MKTFHQLRLPIGRLSDSPYVVVDTETTGLDPEIDRVVEVAALRFESGRITHRFETLVDPGRDIPAGASEQHHLIEEDLVGSPPMEAIEDELVEFVAGDVVVAHNAPFDRSFLPCLESKPWLCSARAARHTWPEAERHRNQFLRYWLRLDAPGLRKAAAHRAAGDAFVTGLVVHQAMKTYEVTHPDAGMGDFMEYVESPIPVTVLRFGKKHYGKKIADVPTTYLQWMLKEVSDLDNDLKAAIDREIGRRYGAEQAA